MTLYQSLADLTDQAIAPALGSDDTLTPEQSKALVTEVVQRLRKAGLIEFIYGFDPGTGAYHLNRQGFRLLDPDDGGAFWAIVDAALDDVEDLGHAAIAVVRHGVVLVDSDADQDDVAERVLAAMLDRLDPDEP